MKSDWTLIETTKNDWPREFQSFLIIVTTKALGLKINEKLQRVIDWSNFNHFQSITNGLQGNAAKVCELFFIVLQIDNFFVEIQF